jgi:hypothetical protein
VEDLAGELEGCARRGQRRVPRGLRGMVRRVVRVGGKALVLAEGEPVIKCPSPLNVLKGTYEHSCY